MNFELDNVQIEYTEKDHIRLVIIFYHLKLFYFFSMNEDHFLLIRLFL